MEWDMEQFIDFENMERSNTESLNNEIISKSDNFLRQKWAEPA
jgi:hypothetical protein